MPSSVFGGDVCHETRRHHKGRQSHMSQSEWQVTVMVKCGRPSQTDVMFVAMNDLAEKVYVEDLIANKIASANLYPCVFDLTLFF